LKRKGTLIEKYGKT